MTQQDIFIKVIVQINNLGFPYMLTGGMVVLFYGKPRTTHDIDIVVEISENNIFEIINSFKEEFYVSEEGIKDAVSHKTMFNIIHPETGMKIDFWMLKDIPYEKVIFQRRVKKEIFGKEVYISTPEDTIIRKLLWYKESDIDKHFNDALGIFQIQHENLDYDYIQQWVKELKVSDIWGKVKERTPKESLRLSTGQAENSP
ncbi:MAG: nucleotidyltransferase [Candidatus Omnitrophica bacterium]|nr:nucleotidyltransferase [Candidatus Omnitrophota bacterium]MBU1048354.1 nucleotidyltransferase [Candidatus Omnitrophota bacterium]MBU1767684.1 nucleotidyltransferase [Candidatus Omnitrophota bacterium]MBU1889664.1 nucleotidyltransferase [Candidatus Omnitrophota bacterium]